MAQVVYRYGTMRVERPVEQPPKGRWAKMQWRAEARAHQEIMKRLPQLDRVVDFMASP